MIIIIIIEYIDYESPDELNASSQEECIDFRVYPLHIDWFEIENTDNNYFDILELYGYFGIATLTSLSNIHGIELLVDDFIYSFLNHYYTSVSDYNDNRTNEFISNLPSLKSINYIINQRMLNKKEVICMKVVIDIYEHHMRTFEHPAIFKMRQLYLSTAGLFYAFLTEEEIGFIYDVLTKQMKNTYTILSKSIIILINNTVKLGCKIKKSKHNYMQYFNDMKNDTVYLVGGSNQNQFIM